MSIDQNLREASAEMLLDYLYPEVAEEFMVRDKGAFYRNYNADILSLDTGSRSLELSRDSFLKLLPEGLYNSPEELKGKDRESKMKKMRLRVHRLEEMCVPIDTEFFLRRLQLERETSELLSQKLDYVLHCIFSFDISKVTSPLVRQMAYLLPYVTDIRGDLQAIRRLLSSLLGHPVNIKTGIFSYRDSTQCRITYVRYEVDIPNLSREEYNEQSRQLQPLADFLQEWFVPVEVVSLIAIKHHTVPVRLSPNSTLNYNTDI